MLCAQAIAAAWTEVRELRSNGSVLTVVLGATARMRSAALAALLAVRQASTTAAPCMS